MITSGFSDFSFGIMLGRSSNIFRRAEMENPDSVSETGVDKVQTCKPGSVFSPEGETPCHLSDRPTLPDIAGTSSPKFRMYMVFQPAKVYPTTESLLLRVSSYLTFSPLPIGASTTLSHPQAVIFCGTCCLEGEPSASIFIECGALCCPDFPPSTKGGQRQGGLHSKGTLKRHSDWSKAEGRVSWQPGSSLRSE